MADKHHRHPRLAGRIALACLVIVLVAGMNTDCVSGPAESQPRATVSVVGLSLDARAQLRRDALDIFTRKTGIQADLIPTLGGSAEQLDLARRLLGAKASSPDVYVMDVVWPGTLADDLLDLRPYLDADAQSHSPELLRNDTVNGRLVCLPFYLNLGRLYYRRDLLEKYGYRQPPQTWDELAPMAARIQRGERAAGRKSFWGYVWQGGAYEGLTCNALEWQASFGGGHIIEADRTISVNNPHTVQALRMAVSWVRRISPPSVLSYAEADTLNAFRSGNAAFMRYWSRGPAAEPGISVAALPAGPSGRAAVMGGFHLGVSRYSAHPREAARLVLYLTGSEVQLRRALSAGYLPTISRLYERSELLAALPHVGPLRSSGAGSWIARPSTVAGTKYRDVSRAYYESVHDILSGKTEVEQGLAALEERLAALTGFPAGRPKE